MMEILLRFVPDAHRGNRQIDEYTPRISSPHRNQIRPLQQPVARPCIVKRREYFAVAYPAPCMICNPVSAETVNIEYGRCDPFGMRCRKSKIQHPLGLTDQTLIPAGASVQEHAVCRVLSELNQTLNHASLSAPGGSLLLHARRPCLSNVTGTPLYTVSRAIWGRYAYHALWMYDENGSLWGPAAATSDFLPVSSQRNRTTSRYPALVGASPGGKEHTRNVRSSTKRHRHAVGMHVVHVRACRPGSRPWESIDTETESTRTSAPLWILRSRTSIAVISGTRAQQFLRCNIRAGARNV